MTYTYTRKSYLAHLFTLSLTFVAFLPSAHLAAQVHMTNLGTTGFELSLEMTPTHDGNYVTVGPVFVSNATNGFSGLFIYLNKVDGAGNLIWSKEILEINSQGGPNNSFPLSVTEMIDAANGAAIGYAVTGMRSTAGDQEPIFIVTTDLNGDPIQYGSYGGNLPIAGAALGAMYGHGAQIIQNNQGQLVVCGSVTLDDFVGRVPFILVVEPHLQLNFLRLYHDVRYFNQMIGFDMRGHFADIEVAQETTSDQTGASYPEGYVVVGTTSKMNSTFTEIVVMRTDLGGFPIAVGVYGPENGNSRGTAIETTSNGNLEVAGLVFTPPPATGGPPIPPSTLVLKLESTLIGILDQDQYHGFVTLGDIRETANGDFLLCGRGAYDADGSILRIKNDGTVVFANGYGGPNVEFFFDTHEMPATNLYASGVTTTWCLGPADEYLTRSLSDGSVPGCNVYPLNLEVWTPSDPQRETAMLEFQMDKALERPVEVLTPATRTRRICPTPIVVHPWPWDWFVRADFNRDLQVNIADVISNLDHLFAGGPASIPVQASDSNSDGVTDISDAIHQLAYLFSSGPAPAAPFEAPGPDPNSTQGNIFVLEEILPYLTGDSSGPPIVDLGL